MNYIKGLSPQRLLFFISLATLSLSGVIIVIMDTWSKGISQHYKHSLNRQLWKFDTKESILCKNNEKIWAWRKLTLAGVMIASVFISVMSKIFTVVVILAISLIFLSAWLCFLMYYWYFIVIVAASSSPVSVQPSVELQNRSWKSKVKDSRAFTDSRLPVTVVTGYLGSGKTTLVKGILSNTVGMKVLVIENEIGAEGVDHDLLMQHTAKEEIILLNNGCVCCTVRSDLIKTFHRLFADDSFARLDWVVIETTGLADPAPLIQSLYMDDECRERLRMDSVITLVDAKHFPQHRVKERQARNNYVPTDGQEKPLGIGAHGGVSEAVLQVTFADRVVVNKVDLVSAEEVQQLVRDIAEINPSVQVLMCEQARVPIEDLLNIRAFDPLRNKALLNIESGSATPSRPILIQRDSAGKILRKKFFVDFAQSNRSSKDTSAQVLGISTVTLSCAEPLSLEAFNQWISGLLKLRGEDIYRTKGILRMSGYEEQFVVQGVHMIFDGERGPPWASDTVGKSRLVMIGINLDHIQLQSEFLACRAVKL